MKKKWSLKYKKSINCKNPKGFSQKQYCNRQKRGGKYLTEKIEKLQNFLSDGCTCEFCSTNQSIFPIIPLEKNNNFSKNLKYHIDNKIPLAENIFRIYSRSFFSLINEVRDLYKNKKILLCPIDKSLIETNLGEYVLYRNKKIFLDVPFEINYVRKEINETDKRNKKINKPFRTSGGPKKFAVYVKDPVTKKIKLVRFGDPNLKIKNNDPKRAASFRARHKCSQKKDKTTPGYWSCNVHKYRKFLGIKSKNPW